MALTRSEREAISWLRTPRAVRERSGAVFARVLEGRSRHFVARIERLPEVAERVAAVTRRTWPGLEIPLHSRWRHFGAGGVDRLAALHEALCTLDPSERSRALFDLAVVSVLLDGGAGARWSYRERRTGLTLARSEGLAVASLEMFVAGGFSSRLDRPMQVDARVLEGMGAAELGRWFQVSARNPLVGLEGRAALLRRLGAALRELPGVFGGDPPRPAPLFDDLARRAEGGRIEASTVLSSILDRLGSIWRGGSEVGGVRLGDVWPHEAAGGEGPGSGLVPFHKLAQWLALSLIEPLEWAGFEVVGVGELTGLAEYRNGGLFVDLGVLEPRHPEVTAAHAVGSEVVVEWRASTVVLLDRLAEAVRERLGMDEESLPVAKLLEGGTWRAGREVARERREGGGPPIEVESDGTVM